MDDEEYDEGGDHIAAVPASGGGAEGAGVYTHADHGIQMPAEAEAAEGGDAPADAGNVAEAAA